MNSTYEHFDIQRLNAISITEVAQALGYELRKAGRKPRFFHKERK